MAIPTPIITAATPSTMNGIRQAPWAPKTEVPNPISGGASKNASVIPIANPVITNPMPRLRFSKGVCSVISRYMSKYRMNAPAVGFWYSRRMHLRNSSNS